MEERVQVILDDRELKSGCAKALYSMDALLTPKRLDVGDYVLSDRACVERKSADDFEASIIDGRLFEQAKQLKATYASPIIIIVGKEFYRVNEKARRGAFLSLMIDYQIPLFFVETEKELAELIHAIAVKEQLQEKRELKLQYGKKNTSLSEQQQLIVESIPLIGPKNAKMLLKHFGSVEKVYEADTEALQECEGIGPTRAKEIRRIITSQYETQ
ncbi:MAG: ERCC4 domain-containing protein [Candidatus Micrarchaeota archaeon]